jgi:purine nucleoside permease
MCLPTTSSCQASRLSPLFPDVHCTGDYTICQLVRGESEINAATTITSLALSCLFDLTQTDFFIADIAGANPERATTSSVMFARYAVQVALQYEIDIPLPHGLYPPGRGCPRSVTCQPLRHRGF